MGMKEENESCLFCRYGTLLVCVLAIFLSYLALGPVMRESDQASILSGALDIARGGDLAGNTAYRYDKFYGTYWQLAAGFKLFGAEKSTDANHIVWLANVLAFSTYSVVLLLLGYFIKLRGPLLITFAITLLSPVLLFTAPLVSPNIFSVSWVLLLAVLFCARESKRSLLGIILVSALAVGSRLDAVLVMPAVALLSSKHGLFKIWRDRRVLAAFVGSVIALGVSRMVGAGHTAGIGEQFFFDPKITAAYLVFGLGAAVGFYFLLALGCLKKYRYSGGALAFAVMIPLLFYIGLLFTPRHLILVPVVVLLSCVLPRGQEIWSSIFEYKGWRRVWVFGCVVGAGLMFVGLTLPSISSPKVSLVTATRYPTTDGYWPMGGTLRFLIDLGDSESNPVDHNQTVWEAWNKIDFRKKPLVLKDRLFRYPELAARIQGEEVRFTDNWKEGFFSERVLRRKGTVFGGESLRGNLLEGLSGVDFIKNGELGIGKVTEGKGAGLLLECVVGQLADGSDVLLLACDDLDFERKILPFRTHRAFHVLSSTVSADKQIKVDWQTNEVDLTKDTFTEGWVVVPRLPNYMKERDGK